MRRSPSFSSTSGGMAHRQVPVHSNNIFNPVPVHHTHDGEDDHDKNAEFKENILCQNLIYKFVWGINQHREVFYGRFKDLFLAIMKKIITNTIARKTVRMNDLIRTTLSNTINMINFHNPTLRLTDTDETLQMIMDSSAIMGLFATTFSLTAHNNALDKGRRTTFVHHIRMIKEERVMALRAWAFVD